MRGEEDWEDKVIMVNDVARAFFEAPMLRDICVELPAEAGEGEDMVGLDHEPKRHARRRRELPGRGQVFHEHEQGGPVQIQPERLSQK